MSASQRSTVQPKMTLPGLEGAATWPVIKPPGSKVLGRRPSLAATFPNTDRPPMVYQVIKIPPETFVSNNDHEDSKSTRLVIGSTLPTVFASEGHGVVQEELEHVTASVPIEAVEFGPHQLLVDAPGEAVSIMGIETLESNELDPQNPTQDSTVDLRPVQRRCERTALPWRLSHRSYRQSLTHRRSGRRSEAMLRRNLRDALRPHVGPFVAVSLRRVARGQIGIDLSDPAAAAAALRGLEDFMTETSTEVVRGEEDHVGNCKDWLVHPRDVPYYHSE